MPKGFTIGNTGAGKTLWVSLYAFEWAKRHPNGQIYANYHLNIPNANFTPIMFLPFDKLQECLIIFDDVSSLETVMRFSKVTANRSRKKQMELIFTAQYYTMIPRQLRQMSDYRVRTYLDKNKDKLKVWINYRERGVKRLVYCDVIQFVKKTNLYNTNEVVDNPTESEVIEEIIRLSKTKRDVEKNLLIYSGNKQERRSLLKEILKKMNLQDENEEEDDDIKYMKNAILRYRYDYEWKALSQKSRIAKTTLVDGVDRVCDNIKEEYLS